MIDGYFILGTLAASFFSFLFGSIFGSYMTIIIFAPFVAAAIIISVVFIVKSVKEKRFHWASLCALIFIGATLWGGSIDDRRTKDTIRDLKLIKEYVIENYVGKISEEMSRDELRQLIREDDYFKQFTYATGLEYDYEGKLKIQYHDAWCYEDEDKIYFRPRP